MTPVTNNNKDLHDEEDNHGHGHEIILRSLPNEDKMPSTAATHPEPEEEPDADEDEQPSSYGRWRPWPWSRSRTLTGFLAAAGVGVVVGGGSVVFRAAAAGGKPSTISSSSMQAVACFDVVGGGRCRDESWKSYPYVQYNGFPTVDACANKCDECVAGRVGSLVGLELNPDEYGGQCKCLLNQTGSLDFSQMCGSNNGASTDDKGNGPIFFNLTRGAEDWTCYGIVGGGGGCGTSTSKSSKTRASKASNAKDK